MTVSSFYTVALAEMPIEIALENELVRGAEAQVVEALLPHVQRESVALNLARVERIDAAGIAALITLYCSAVQAGTEFSVVDPSTHVLELLHLVGLDAILMAGDRTHNRSRDCGCLTAA